jgi:serine/threonine protein kinase
MFYDRRSAAMAGVYPRRFGKYVLLKPMARGGMGEIYLAATGDSGFQKFCVIKKIIAEKSDRAKANRFLDEAKVVLRLSHANLVPTFDAGEIDGEFFIAMDLVEGKDLREIWNRCVRTRTRIPLDVALHIGREIARALAYVHSYGDLSLVHRDVAPPNILLSYFGEVKLTDFGLARSVLKSEQTAPGVVFGRASYLAPEQARGEVADARTDVYSLGIVLWELLTGNQYLQLASLDPATAMSLVRHPRPASPSSKAPWISKTLDKLLMRALAPERDERFQSAEEMRQALSDAMAEVAPRADAERAATFVRNLYDTAIRDERLEREKLLADSQALASPPPATAAPPPATTPAPASPAAPAAAPPRSTPAFGTVLSRDAVPDKNAIPLARLADASVPVKDGRRSAPMMPAIPGLTFPTEDEPSGVDFTGRVINGRYRVHAKIGEGGMGTVYAAEHVEIGKGVAIKILHPRYSTEQELVERFRREARAASRIGHPHIIDVMDFGSTDDGCAYFIMELLDGIDLADVLTHERRLDPDRSCQIAIQICRALSAAHAAGVIHRDLKPENIFLVARDGQADFVKVLDFGVARSAGRSRRLTNPGVAMGTPEYMAPEQAAGGVVDHRSDIYSVGALLYEMATGLPPQKRDGGMMPPRSLRLQLSEEMDRIIVRALEAEPDKRYQSMAQLEYDLAKTLFGRTRAVSDLLGLRQPEARRDDAEAPGEAQAAPTLPHEESLGEALLERLDARRAARTATPPLPTPLSPAKPPLVTPRLVTPPVMTPAATPVPAPPSYHDVALARPTPTGMRAPHARRRGSGRFLGTAAVLVLAGVAAVPIYRRLPWNLRAQTAPAPAAAPAPPVNALTPGGAAQPGSAAVPAPSEAESKAARARAAAADVERLLASGPGFDKRAALDDGLRRMRAAGASADADKLAASAKAALIKAAEAELDGGDLDAGVAHYKAAAKLAPEESDMASLSEAIRLRALAALVQRQDAEAAVRLARQGLLVAGDQPQAHGLLADMLYAAQEYEESVAEYRAALAGAPDDAALKRGLDRARKKLGQDKAKAAASSSRTRARAAAAGAEASPAEDKAADAETASPPSEPAAE